MVSLACNKHSAAGFQRSDHRAKHLADPLTLVQQSREGIAAQQADASSQGEVRFQLARRALCDPEKLDKAACLVAPVALRNVRRD
jgi:hypothetical protein